MSILTIVSFETTHALFICSHEILNERDQSLDWYQKLLAFISSDPSLLNKMSDIADSERDKHQSLSHLSEVSTLFITTTKCNIEVSFSLSNRVTGTFLLTSRLWRGWLVTTLRIKSMKRLSDSWRRHPQFSE